MRRRDVILGAGAAGAAALAAGCSRDESQAGDTAPAFSGKPRHWKMVTSWPANFPGLGTGASDLAERITAASGGRLTVKVYAGGELVPPFEVFDAVSRGTAQMGHSASYYWSGKAPAAPFFCAVPFGLNAQEMNSWLDDGGGLELWRELYSPFGLVPFAAGNTGVQMAGWFRRPIDSLADLRGLKMRIPGLGSAVLSRLGAAPVNLPGAEIFTAMQQGTIDATEWVGPYNDLAFGLHKVARYCYYPGWQEPGSTLEAMINADAWAELEPDLQAIVSDACAATNGAMLAEYTARNRGALDQLQADGVEFRQLPPDVLVALRRESEAVLEEVAAADPMAGRVWASMKAFRESVKRWHAVSERAYYAARDD